MDGWMALICLLSRRGGGSLRLGGGGGEGVGDYEDELKIRGAH